MPDPRPTLGQVVEQLGVLAGSQARLRAEVDQLAQIVTTVLSRARQGQPEEAEESAAWLDCDDPDQALETLEDLRGWLARVWSAYPGGELAACWEEHPTVVEELLALRRAHGEAYGRRGSGAAAVQWHSMYRPGVAARVGEMLGGAKGCQAHRPRLHAASPSS